MPKGIYGTVLIATVASLCSAAAAQQTSNYRVEARDTDAVILNLCSNEIEVYVDGDGDTDLDFVIRDNNGRVVHEDRDGTDLTIATVRPRRPAGGCVNYTLYVSNLGDVYNRYEVRLTGRDAPTRGSADRQNRQIAIHNHTAESFVSLRWSNTAENTWGPNRLASTMGARTNRTVTVDDGTGSCRFDIMVRTASGREYTKSNIDVCAVSTVEFGTEISHY